MEHPPVKCVCGDPVPAIEEYEVWMTTGLGMTCRHAHPGCADRAIKEVGEVSYGARRREQPRTNDKRKRTDNVRSEYEELAEQQLFVA